MGRRERRNSNYGKSGISMYVTFSIIGVIAIAFILAYVLYSNKLSKQEKTANIEKASNLASIASINAIENTKAEQTSTSVGKKVEDVKSENEKENAQNSQNTINKIAVNTSKQEKEEISKRNEENTNTQNKNLADESKNVTQNENTANESKEETKNENQTIVDTKFIAPVDGEIIKDYAKENLVYSNTLEEWLTHLGIDYAAEKTSIVKAAADGKIKSIKNDPRYGLTIVIEHQNGFESKYSSLLSSEFVSVGEEVKQGQTIGTVGNTATFEVSDQTHLHFEITKDGESVNPNNYLK